MRRSKALKARELTQTRKLTDGFGCGGAYFCSAFEFGCGDLYRKLQAPFPPRTEGMKAEEKPTGLFCNQMCFCRTKMDLKFCLFSYESKIKKGRYLN